jgi:hypothetical protein
MMKMACVKARVVRKIDCLMRGLKKNVVNVVDLQNG